MTFGEKLKKYRIEAGMTQQELAHKANISTNTIMNYESGRTYPKKRETYVQLAEILGVNADHLHNENDEFLSDVTAAYGSRGARQAKELIAEVSGLFAGGELAPEDMDEMMKAIQDAYWIAKENNKKFAPKKYQRGK